MTVLAARPLVVADSSLDLIGKTPMVRLSRFAGSGTAEILAKCEFLNPGGSVKDRIGVGMIRYAEEEGFLKPGGTIIEPTAGNTGIGLALVGVARGYRVILCVPERFSIEKQKIMTALGGSVVRTPDALGMKGAIEKARALAKEIPGAYVPQQIANPSNPRAHYETTGPEILEQCEGRLDAIVIGAGSTGTFMGVAQFLVERLPALLKVAVEPQGSILGGGKPGPHKVEGIGASFLPEIWNASLADEIIAIDDEEAFAAVLEIARTEGLLVGGSSGCNAAAARRIARRFGPGKRVVTLLPDGAERYVSKGILG
jgi:O-acetylserine dependent cystathionine beta-synthase